MTGGITRAATQGQLWAGWAWRSARGADAARGLLARARSALSLSLLANHFPALHGIRVLAVLSVMQVHTTRAMLSQGLLPRSAVTDFSRNVFFGMDLFFLLSGFLIGTLLLHARTTGNRGGVLRFYLRRGFRTFPLYYAVLAVLLVFAATTPMQRAHVWTELLYLANYGHASHGTRIMPWGWSLCVEEHFYLVVAPLFALLHLVRGHRVRLAILGGGWLAGLGVRLAVYFGHDGPWTAGQMFQEIYIRTHTRFDVLVAGLIVAYLQHHYRDEIRRFLGRDLGWALVRVVPMTCLTLLLVPRVIFPDLGLFKVLAWGTVTSLMYAPLVLLLVNDTGRFASFLSLPIFRRAATLGYGVYLVHVPLGGFLQPLAERVLTRYGVTGLPLWVATFTALIALSFAVSYLLHLAVEKPALALRDRLAP